MIEVANGAGICKTLEDVRKFSQFAINRITVGSVTIESREGNPGDNLYLGPGYSVNSLGLPNQGLEYFLKNVREMSSICHRADKKLRMSIAGFTVEELIHLAAVQHAEFVDEIEVNFGCPNTGDNIQSYQPDFVYDVLSGITGNIPVSVKMTPIFDHGLMAELASIISESVADSVTVMNAIPNAYCPEIFMKFGGYAGHNVLPIGLGQVAKWRLFLHPEIEIIGVGGIETAEDAKRYVEMGAQSVQITTGYLAYGEQVFYRVFDGLNSGEL